MTIEQASNFFIGSILTMFGFIVVCAGIVVINNILFKFWKPVRIFTPESWKAFNPPPHVHEEQVNERLTKKSS